ncbi:MAG TPA: four-carbon acid sugar kinase family protein, partial [Verrucomicrobiae bacterium]|nr:four-carbon acid sugar kinase family protein [Verrucomicrobiae bacterium]
MNKLLLTFYGDDFTGSTDALEQLTLAGVRAVLFTEPPTPAQLKRFPKLQAVGVAGLTRSLPPAAMEKELRPAFKKLKALGARHVHYKVCSTFDSSPEVGSIGCAIDVGMEVFHPPFVPLLVAAPALGRYCVFGNLFARFGIGSDRAIYRLDRHPSASRHPVTPMTEADLRLHLAKQTKRKVALFDILKVTLPAKEARTALRQILTEKPDIVLFDALHPEHLGTIGGLIDSFASAKRPLFSVGSSGIEMALGAHWIKVGKLRRGVRSAQRADPTTQILIGSGS